MSSNAYSPGAPGRAISISVILLLAVAIHGPLMLMQLPSLTYDANTHMFFAQHYAQHWFDPWNPKWFAGFSQTTYPPLVHQWIALFSYVMGITWAYMLVQLISILLLVTGVYRFARLWVGERSAAYAAVAAVFLGSLAQMVYQSGQLPTTLAAALTLNALPYFYLYGLRGRFMDLLKGVAITVTAAAAHHVTVIFGMVLFALPVLALAILDRKRSGEDATTGGVITRSILFGALSAIGIGIVLLPFWIALLKYPITQMPIPHGSRDNYLLNTFSGMNFWVIPTGVLILAIPYMFWKGLKEVRLRPLFFGWYLTFLFGLGGTTPVGRVLLGRAYEVLTFERFTFWATLMMLPVIGLLASYLLERYATRAAVGLWIAAVFTFGIAVGWTQAHPIGGQVDTDAVSSFMNRDQHSKFRYMTLGFGPDFAKVSRETSASSVDGDYNSARLLPEMTRYGAGKLDGAKYFGSNGMESLRAMLKHANRYGLKYIFVRDPFYEPLLAFAGWRPIESFESGAITLWSKEDVPPAQPVESPMHPTPVQGLLWGILPVGASVFSLFLVFGLPERRRLAQPMPFPSPAPEPVLREAK